MNLKLFKTLGGALCCVLMAGSPLYAAGKYDSSYTSIRSGDCQTINMDVEGGSSVQNCASFRNIGVQVLEGDLRQSLTLVMNGREYPLNFWTHITHGFSVLGNLVEWRHVKGQPDQLAGMIVRLTASEGLNAEKTTSYLVVTKVTSGEVCVLGKVPPHVRENQNAKARAIAEQANQLPCYGD